MSEDLKFKQVGYCPVHVLARILDRYSCASQNLILK